MWCVWFYFWNLLRFFVAKYVAYVYKWSISIWEECFQCLLSFADDEFFLCLWFSHSLFIYEIKIVNVIQMLFILTCFWLWICPFLRQCVKFFLYDCEFVNIYLMSIIFLYIFWSYGLMYVKVDAFYISLVNCTFNEFETSFFVPLTMLCLVLILLHLLSFGSICLLFLNISSF